MTCPTDNVIDLAAYRRSVFGESVTVDHLAEVACLIARHSWSTESAGTDIKKH